MKMVARIYRDPADAQRAVENLLSAGFKAGDLGVAARLEHTAMSVLGDKMVSVDLSGTSLAASGSLASALSKGSAEGKKASEALVAVLGVSDEAAEYYDFVLGAGGVLVAVQVAEDKEPEVKKALGDADSVPQKAGVASPGFKAASRMAGSNPVDAAMTGDFRKY